MQQKTKELLRTSEQQVTVLKTQLASASSSEAGTATPVTRPVALRAPLRGKGEGGGGGILQELQKVLPIMKVLNLDQTFLNGCE